MRCSTRQRWRLRRRAGDVRHGATNGDVWRSPGSVVIMYAHCEGGTWSVGAYRGRRSGACLAWWLASWVRSVRVVQGLATFERWTGSGGGVLACSQTCCLGLFLLLACCPHWGDMVSFGCSPLMALP